MMAVDDSAKWRREQDGERFCWDCDAPMKDAAGWRRTGFSPSALLCNACFADLGKTPIGQYSQEADYVREEGA